MKILLAMSGGVDSSYCAKLLKDEGNEVCGAYMILHDKKAYHEHNINNVKKICNFFGMQYEILDLRDQFKKNVYEPFIFTYKNGKTPNPCALCNRFIKFGELIKFAKNLGFDKLATGHYARIENGFIKAAIDKSKDQSYFLANTEPNCLEFMLFPLGDKLKSEVKQSAFGIEILNQVATQKESSEICFVDNTYIDILKTHLNTEIPGIVRDKFNQIIGSHKGYMHYTIGKRSGFRIDGTHEPHYVIKIDANANEIIVGSKDDLKCTHFSTSNFNNFMQNNACNLMQEFRALIKIRYKSPAIWGSIIPNKNGLDIRLDEPIYAIAPGQLAVFYDEFERVLGSGFIA